MVEAIDTHGTDAPEPDAPNPRASIRTVATSP
jgi:hypothetical protein